MSSIAEIKQKGMFYTKDVFSKLLVRNISTRRPQNIVELGVGDGALIKHAVKKWKKAKFTCTDVNQNEFTDHAKNPKIKFLIESGLNANLIKILKRGKTEYDVAICNPPYLKVSMQDIFKYKKMIDAFDDQLYSKIKLISSEFIFLVQNVLLLRNKGTLGIIVPDSILTRKEFSPIRDSIIKNYNILCTIELPEKIFTKTEAKTHILILRKEKPKSDYVRVCLANKDGSIVKETMVFRESLVERMDFGFVNSNLNSRLVTKAVQNAKFNLRIYRGNVTHAELKTLDKPFIHSTTFKNDKAIFGRLEKYPRKYSTKVYAEKGDLVMVRVGRGCVGKFARVKAGKLLVSDCIFVFKSSDKNEVQRFEDFLKLNEGKAFMKMLVHGTCSKVISKSDLEEKLLFRTKQIR